jgi:hypothetical protein
MADLEAMRAEGLRALNTPSGTAKVRATWLLEVLTEVERHRNANLVKAVVNFRPVDEWIIEAINAEDFDRVPWVVADKLANENRRLEREITLRERQT